MSWLSDFIGDGRNIGENITNALKVPVEWSCYLIDIRLGFKRNGKWKNYIQWPPWNFKPVTQNFWNGIFTFNIYILKTTFWGFLPMIIPRFDLVVRPAHDWWFETGMGYLFDRGEFGGKCVIMTWKGEGGIDAQGWQEGSV